METLERDCTPHLPPTLDYGVAGNSLPSKGRGGRARANNVYEQVGTCFASPLRKEERGG